MWKPFIMPIATIVSLLSILTKPFVASGVSCSGALPTKVLFNFELMNHFENVTWKLANNVGSIIESGGPYVAADFDPSTGKRRYYEWCILPCAYYNFTIQNSAGTGVEEYVLAVVGNGGTKMLANDPNFGYANSTDVFGCDEVPSFTPSISSQPSSKPTLFPSINPTMIPSSNPSLSPSALPSFKPSLRPSFTSSVSLEPTKEPSRTPTLLPSELPSPLPSNTPSSDPSVSSPPTVPQILQCTSDEVLVEFIIKTDENAHETTWSLRDMQTNQIVYDSTNGVLQKNTEQKYKICIEKCVAHELEVNDRFGDGIGCNQTSAQCDGYYSLVDHHTQSVLATGNLITNVFGEKQSVTLCKSNSPSVVPSSFPSSYPTQWPSTEPTVFPSRQPSWKPSFVPSTLPSVEPSMSPSGDPSSDPSSKPSSLPSTLPSVEPSESPSTLPSTKPSSYPSNMPSLYPSEAPSSEPSTLPSSLPSVEPSESPSSEPSMLPSMDPSSLPSDIPSGLPSYEPSSIPSVKPSDEPSTRPSNVPSNTPSEMPSVEPSGLPTTAPSNMPSFEPSDEPSIAPSDVPSMKPSDEPSNLPSFDPSVVPSKVPSNSPSNYPSSEPSTMPSIDPSTAPSDEPSFNPTMRPSKNPSTQPSFLPSMIPSVFPSSSARPSIVPTAFVSSFHSSENFDIRLGFDDSHIILCNGPFEIRAKCSMNSIVSLEVIIKNDARMAISVYGFVPTTSSIPTYFVNNLDPSEQISKLLWNSVDDKGIIYSSSGYYIRVQGSVIGMDSEDTHNLSYFGGNVDCVVAGEILFGYNIPIVVTREPSDKPSTSPVTGP